MTRSRRANHLIVDDFLPAALSKEFLEFAVIHERKFERTTVHGERAKPGIRNSRWCKADIGYLKAQFDQHVEAELEQIFLKLGMQSFTPFDLETEMVAHGDGGFYRPHIDTLTKEKRTGLSTDRVVSCVYYFHKEPKPFEGGELALFAIGSREQSDIVAPRHNRLVAFPSFVMHEVRPIRCRSFSFDQSRFSMNCWIHRPIVKSQS